MCICGGVVPVIVSCQTLLFLCLSYIVGEPQHSGPIACAYFWFELEDLAQTASLGTNVLLECQFRKLYFWNTCSSTKQIHAERSLLFPWHFSAFWPSGVSPLLFTTSCSLTQSCHIYYSKKPQNGGSEIHSTFQRPSLRCLLTPFCLPDFSFHIIAACFHCFPLSNHSVHSLCTGVISLMLLGLL